MSLRIINDSPSDRDDAKSCLFRIPSGKKRAIWQVTNICNYGCKYCVFASGPRKIPGELSTERAYHLIQELRDLDFTSIKVTGGEPLARRDIGSILIKIREVGLDFDLSSNVSLLTPKLAGVIAEAQPRYVHVSLDGGSKDVQERIRGTGSFEGTLRGLKLLKQSDIPVRIGVAVCRENLLGLAATVARAIEVEADEVVLSVMELGPRSATLSGGLTEISDRELESSYVQLKDLYGSQIKLTNNLGGGDYGCMRCPGGKDFIYIDNYGRVAPCTWAVDRGVARMSENSLGTAALQDLIADSSIQRFRDSIERNNRFGCPVRSV